MVQAVPSGSSGSGRAFARSRVVAARRRGVASGQEPRQSPVSGLATNDDFVCATIFGLDEKVVDHASTKLDQRTPTAADLKLLTTAMGETLPPARRLDLRFDRAIAFVQPLYADDGRTIATLFARFSTERAIAEYMRGIVYDALGGLLVLVTVALLLYVLVARVTAPGAVDGSHPSPRRRKSVGRRART
jgi:hypothetical protein